MIAVIVIGLALFALIVSQMGRGNPHRKPMK